MSYTVGDDKSSALAVNTEVCGYRQAYLHDATCIPVRSCRQKVSHSILHANEMELIDCNCEYCVDAN